MANGRRTAPYLRRAPSDPICPTQGVPGRNFSVGNAGDQTGASLASGAAQPYVNPVGTDKDRNEPNRDTEFLNGADVGAGCQGSQVSPATRDLESSVANVRRGGVGAANRAGRALAGPEVIPDDEQWGSAS